MGRSLVSGEVFAGYRIERLLGAGGMGEVFLARDLNLPRLVALKLLDSTRGADPGLAGRFRREADTAARLSHPNIVAVHARGEQDGRLWIAMEFVDGTDVDELLRGGPLPPARAVRVLEDVAAALDHAHRSGVLHRDVKPANILLTAGPRERALLADFGIAKSLDESTGLTRTGEVFASLRYAAPEQFTEAAVDHRADIYALGGTLHHMLTGSHPYPGTSSAQLIHSHLNRPPPVPSALDPRLPRGFDVVIARAMAKDPAARYPTCGDLAEAAAAALTGTADRSGPTAHSGSTAPSLSTSQSRSTQISERTRTAEPAVNSGPASASTARLPARARPAGRRRRRHFTLALVTIAAVAVAICGTGVVAVDAVRGPVVERLHKARELAGGFAHRVKGALHDVVFLTGEPDTPAEPARTPAPPAEPGAR
ncbi:serine/threonine-protein kinase [Nocardia sp. NPDC024068]|uniref:serine/threonine-protein kinase n=1 Tax=Nocardia sp. NPDC024068 TaxID=3157197 RepID=UPI0033D74504